MVGFKSPSGIAGAMRKLLSLLALVALIAGCTSPSNDTPTPTPATTTPADPVFPTPTPTPATPTPGNSTNETMPDTNETTPDTNETEPPMNETPVTKRVTWSFNLTIGAAGSSVIPGTSAGTAEANCISIPSTHIYGGMANATWNATSSAVGAPTSFDLRLKGANNTSANATGVSPLSITFPEIPTGGNSTVLVQYTSPPALPTQTAVKLDLWFDMMDNMTAPTMPVPAACARVA